MVVVGGRGAMVIGVIVWLMNGMYMNWWRGRGRKKTPSPTHMRGSKDSGRFNVIFGKGGSAWIFQLPLILGCIGLVFVWGGG